MSIPSIPDNATKILALKGQKYASLINEVSQITVPETQQVLKSISEIK